MSYIESGFEGLSIDTDGGITLTEGLLAAASGFRPTPSPVTIANPEALSQGVPQGDHQTVIFLHFAC